MSLAEFLFCTSEPTGNGQKKKKKKNYPATEQFSWAEIPGDHGT